MRAKLDVSRNVPGLAAGARVQLPNLSGIMPGIQSMPVRVDT